MSRTLYGQGSLGGTVESIQRALCASTFDTKGIDGSYGANTTEAVRAFQRDRGLPVTGIVDTDTWKSLMNGAPIPGVNIRALELTAAFEGHGYTLAQGNWDGAWLTWGIVGFTMKHGEVQKIVLEIQNSSPDLINRAFGNNGNTLVAVMKDTPRNQEKWANTISVGARVAEPWLSGFRLFGQIREVQDLQRKTAYDDYFVPALGTSRNLSFKTELGIALCHDIHVQDGGIGPEAQSDIDAACKTHGNPITEPQLREIVANAVADNASPKYAADVRSRKLTIARGAGDVHNQHFVLADWGLDETPY